MTAIGATDRRAAAPAPEPLELYRDDGPLARALGRLGAALRVPPASLIVVAALPLLTLLAIEGEGADEALVGAAIGWFVVLAGLTAGRASRGRLRWTAPPALRLVEYVTLLWLGALAGESSEAAAIALLCALAFRHYDLVYRLRHQGVATPRWVGDLAGGWAGRLVAGWLLWVVGALPAAFFVAAGALGALFVAESVQSWRRWDARGDHAGGYEGGGDE